MQHVLHKGIPILRKNKNSNSEILTIVITSVTSFSIMAMKIPSILTTQWSRIRGIKVSTIVLTSFHKVVRYAMKNDK